MSIQTEISRLEQAKSDIKSSIESKGVSVPSSSSLDSYPALINMIPSLEFVKIVNTSDDGYSSFVVITEDSESGGLCVTSIPPGGIGTTVKGSLIFVPFSQSNVVTSGTITYVRDIYDWPPHHTTGSLFKIQGDGYIAISPNTMSISDSEALSIITGGNTV